MMPLALTLLAAAPLIDAKADLNAPVELPKNPFADASAPPDVRLGYRIFTTVSGKADLSCSNCHLDGAQKDRALPLVGASADEGRVRQCFVQDLQTEPDEPTVKAVTAYLRWLSDGYGPQSPWLHRNTVQEQGTASGDGQHLFAQNCSACHGEDGQGKVLPVLNRRVPPLWGDGTWTQASPFARPETLAGFIRWAMPYWAPGTLSDADALAIARFIDSQPRPAGGRERKPQAHAMR